MKIYPIKTNSVNNAIRFGSVSEPTDNSVENNFTLKAALNSKNFSGKSFGEEYQLERNGNNLIPETLSGNIGEKQVNIKIDNNSKMTGFVGDKQVNMDIKKHFDGYSIDGNIGTQTISVKINNFLHFNYWDRYITGDGVNIHTWMAFNKNIMSLPNIKFAGQYDSDKDFLPILCTLATSV